MLNIKRLNTTKHLIAYIDILGFKNLLKKNQNIYISILYDFIKNVKCGAPGTGKLAEMFSTIVFSDNVVIAYEIEGLENSKIREIASLMFCYLMCIQTQALSNSFLLRGAIKIGDLYINKESNFIIGMGLSDTYMQESNLAIYPRIITTDKNVLSIANELDLGNGISISNYWIKDVDNIFYLDYLQTTQMTNDKTSMLIAFQNALNNDLRNQNFSDEKEKQKYAWHINYFNNFCERFNQPQLKIGALDE